MKLLLLLLMPWHILTWGDFKGKVTDKTNAANSNITMQWDYKQTDTMVYDVKASVFFDPYRSYTSTRDPYILKHEQGHLDLCLIYVRKANALAKYSFLFPVKDFELLRQDIENEWNLMDDRYDFETNHSVNREAQARWNKWIQEQLR